MKADAFRYDGKRAVVVGGATGMGAATAELVQDLGAEVVVMDYAPVTLAGVKAINVNLADKASIDAAVDECGGPIHALFSCAGAATQQRTSGYAPKTTSVNAATIAAPTPRPTYGRDKR